MLLQYTMKEDILKDIIKSIGDELKLEDNIINNLSLIVNKKGDAPLDSINREIDNHILLEMLKGQNNRKIARQLQSQGDETGGMLMIDEMKKYLDPSEVQKIAGKPLKVIKYSDLIHVNNLDDLFSKDFPAILLLYETKENSGHWIIMIKHRDRIEFFDSYGLMPDDELKFTPKKFRKENNMDVPVLTWLMLHSRYPIEYNDFQFQTLSEDIGTCGRWCGIRYQMSDTSLDDFIDTFKQIPSNTRDLVVTRLSEM